MSSVPMLWNFQATAQHLLFIIFLHTMYTQVPMWMTRQHPFLLLSAGRAPFWLTQRAHLMLLPATHREGTMSATTGRCSPAAAGSGSPRPWTQQQPWLCPALPWRVFSIDGKHPALKQLFCLHQKTKQAINYMETFHRMNLAWELQHRLQWLYKLGLLDNRRSKAFKSGYKCTDFTASQKSHVLHTQGNSVCLLSDTRELLTVSTSTCQINNGHWI